MNANLAPSQHEIESHKDSFLKLRPKAEALFDWHSRMWFVFETCVPGSGKAYHTPIGQGNTASEAWKAAYLSRSRV